MTISHSQNYLPSKIFLPLSNFLKNKGYYKKKKHLLQSPVSFKSFYCCEIGLDIRSIIIRFISASGFIILWVVFLAPCVSFHCWSTKNRKQKRSDSMNNNMFNFYPIDPICLHEMRLRANGPSSLGGRNFSMFKVRTWSVGTAESIWHQVFVSLLLI